MSTPNAVLAVYSALVADTGVRAAVGPKSPIVDPVWTYWIWRNSLAHTIENSQQAAIVIRSAGGWASPNAHNTMNFPRVIVEIWADPTRNSDSSIQVKDAEDKAIAVAGAVDAVLHTSFRSSTFTWGGQRVISSQRLGEIEFFGVVDGEGMVRAEVHYGLTMG